MLKIIMGSCHLGAFSIDQFHDLQDLQETSKEFFDRGKYYTQKPTFYSALRRLYPLEHWNQFWHIMLPPLTMTQNNVAYSTEFPYLIDREISAGEGNHRACSGQHPEAVLWGVHTRFSYGVHAEIRGIRSHLVASFAPKGICSKIVRFNHLNLW